MLLVAGRVDKRIISSHRRLSIFTVDDYELLVDLLRHVDRVFVTPNTLTEASNLLAQHGEPQRSQLLDYLGVLIRSSEELVITSATASRNSQFRRLGLTDVVLLELVTPDTPLLTVDVPLFLAASQQNAGINFTHMRTHLDS